MVGAGHQSPVTNHQTPSGCDRKSRGRARERRARLRHVRGAGEEEPGREREKGALPELRIELHLEGGRGGVPRRSIASGRELRDDDRRLRRETYSACTTLSSRAKRWICFLPRAREASLSREWNNADFADSADSAEKAKSGNAFLKIVAALLSVVSGLVSVVRGLRRFRTAQSSSLASLNDTRALASRAPRPATRPRASAESH